MPADAQKFLQIKLQEIEQIKASDPVTYEALRSLEAAFNQNAGVLNEAVGSNLLVIEPNPEGYQPQGVVTFSTDEHLHSVPPPGDSEDPQIPPPPSPRVHPVRMQIVRLSERGRIPRVVAPRGGVAVLSASSTEPGFRLRYAESQDRGDDVRRVFSFDPSLNALYIGFVGGQAQPCSLVDGELVFNDSVTPPNDEEIVTALCQ